MVSGLLFSDKLFQGTLLLKKLMFLFYTAKLKYYHEVTSSNSFQPYNTFFFIPVSHLFDI